MNVDLTLPVYKQITKESWSPCGGGTNGQQCIALWIDDRYKASHELRAKIYECMCQKLGVDYNVSHVFPLFRWNDTPGRTFEEVVELLKYAEESICPTQ